MHCYYAMPNGKGCQTPEERGCKYAIARTVCEPAEARRFRDWNWCYLVGALQGIAIAKGYGQDMLDGLKEAVESGYQQFKPKKGEKPYVR